MATSGPNSPGTLADDSGVGTIAWSNPSNAASSNNSYATAALAISEVSHYLKATNFGFSIPGGSTINGITVEIEQSQTGALIKDHRVRIVKGGSIGSTDKAAAGNWTVMDGYITYGGAADLWGETWTDSDINATTFGVAIAAINNGAMATAQVDHIRITITYTAGAAGAAKQSTISNRAAVRRAANY